MKQLAIFFETSKGKRVKNIIIGCGASVVLMGALFKLQHWAFASEMLIIGMSVEAFIFALQGILPPHKDYYWEKLYPNLDISPETEPGYGIEHKGGSKGGGVSQQLDEMLEKANVETELIGRLGKNMEKFSKSVESMKDVGNSIASTNEYASKTKEASAALTEMTRAYQKATSSVKTVADSVGAMAMNTDDSKKYHVQVQQLSKNIATLNSMYELELQDTNSHLKAMNKFYGSLTQAMNALNDSVDDTQAYKKQIGKLAKNLESLNNVYGNMLSAMSIGRAQG